MIFWFWQQIINFCIICCKLDVSIFSRFFHSFSKNCIICQLKKSFSKSFFSNFLALLLMYAFNRAFWLDIIRSFTFLNTNLWFSASNFITLCKTYYFFSYKLAESFSTFLIFILSSKNGKSLWRLCNFLVDWTSVLKNIQHHTAYLQSV